MELLLQVIYAYRSGGPLAEDASDIALSIEPPGFNRTQVRRRPPCYLACLPVCSFSSVSAQVR